MCFRYKNKVNYLFLKGEEELLFVIFESAGVPKKGEERVRSITVRHYI